MAAWRGPVEAVASRSYFYVGGEYIETPVGHLLQKQMYVERLVPSSRVRQQYPLVFIHGGAQTGTNWLNKPDGDPGWASWFLSRGYEVYIIDQTIRGRSPLMWPDEDIGLTTITAEVIQKRFTATKEYASFPHSQFHTQWPGSGKMGDPVFDAYFSSLVQFVPNTVETETMMKNAGTALLDKIGPAILIAHSQGAIFAWSWGDARPDLVRAIVCIEPSGPPFQDSIMTAKAKKPYGLTSLPLTFSPPGLDGPNPLEIEKVSSSTSNLDEQTDCMLQVEPARQLVNLKNIPVLVETGQASYHAAYDHCSVAFLKQAGVQVEHLKLANIGIFGNGHMQFMEKNSDEIAAVIEAWIKKVIAKSE